MIEVNTVYILNLHNGICQLYLNKAERKFTRSQFLPPKVNQPFLQAPKAMLEKAIATHSSTLAWKIPWAEEPGGLQFMGSLRVGHDWATSLSWIGEGNGNPLQCSCLENPRDRGALWDSVYGVAQSRTRLERLSSSSSSSSSSKYSHLYLFPSGPGSNLGSAH